MPEGPEIRRAADRIAAVLVDRRVEAVYFGLPALGRYERRLTGKRVTAIETRGKAMLTHFDNDLAIFSHNQLYGRWFVTKGRTTPCTRRSLRVGLYTAEHSALLYSASNVAVLDAGGLAAHPFLARLGPDLLDPSLDARTVAARLCDDAFRRRALGGLLLDQGFVAGTGNYLRSEILHFAGLAPDRRPDDLAADELRRLARQILAVARRSYRSGGLTNPPARVAELKRAGLTRARRRFAVFGREGRPCYACGARIRRADVSGRRLYFCPSCQDRGP